MFGDVVMPADVLRTTLRKDGATEPESAALRPEPQANMDEGAAARLMAASALHASGRRSSIKGRLATFCASRAARSNYRLPDSAVPGKMWMAGPGAAHTAQGYGAATGSVRPLVDAAMESLRREGKRAHRLIG